MLTELYVKDFALIDELRIEMGPGFNVLTGETGAGKSLIIDAVGLVLGGRATSDMVRTGADEAVIEGVFDITDLESLAALLSEAGIEAEDGTLIVTREIARSGKNKCRINGRTVTLGMVAEVGAALVDIHGQHEHQSLLHVSRHLELLDRFGGSKIWPLRREVEELFTRLSGLEKELSRLRADGREKARRMDLLRFQVNEIDAANLRPGEEEELEAERLVLANAEQLFDAAAFAVSALLEGSGDSPAVDDTLGAVLARLSEAAKVDPSLKPVMEALSGAEIAVREAARELRSYRDRIDFSPHRLDQVTERLETISRLKRKYGDTVEAILAYRVKTGAELASIEHSEEREAELTAEIAEAKRRLADVAGRLSRERKALARDLEGKIAEELAELEMPRARFSVAVERDEDDEGLEVDGGRWAYGPKGIDRVEFLMSANPGEDLKPLARIASGGEMSRVMLALKAVLARLDEIPTMIFDEIDTGIGGKAALAVAEKLKAIGSMRQVMCVTHQAVIAARGDVHFYISKAAEADRTVVKVRRLSGEERVREIARMMGGASLTQITLEHAREMLEESARRA